MSDASRVIRCSPESDGPAVASGDNSRRFIRRYTPRYPAARSPPATIAAVPSSANPTWSENCTSGARSAAVGNCSRASPGTDAPASTAVSRWKRPPYVATWLVDSSTT